MHSQPQAYGWLMFAGIVLSICFWSRIARRDDRLLAVYAAALIGAFLGAKVVYFFAEGYRHLGAQKRADERGGVNRQ